MIIFPKKQKLARYLAKIFIIGGADPFLSVIQSACSQPPALNACDLVSYLKKSFITITQFKARKGLEAYNQFIGGWVKDVTTNTAKTVAGSKCF